MCIQESQIRFPLSLGTHRVHGFVAYNNNLLKSSQDCANLYSWTPPYCQHFATANLPWRYFFIVYACKYSLAQYLPAFPHIILTCNQPLNITNTIIICSTIQDIIHFSINEWHLHYIRSSTCSLHTGTNRDHVLPLGMPSIQERRYGGPQATTVHRLPEFGTTFGAMDMLIILVSLPSSNTTATSF
jgi:hypothetical protein